MNAFYKLKLMGVNGDGTYEHRALSSRLTRFVIYDLAGGKCQMCGAGLTFSATKTWQIDHVTPVCDGGKTELSNLQVLCRACHDGKSSAEKSRVALERHARTRAGRWLTHREKDVMIGELREQVAVLRAELDERMFVQEHECR